MVVPASIRLQMLAIAVTLPLAGEAQSQGPTAIVEEIEAQAPSIQLMDYLTAGTVVRLAPSERLVLGYLKSCWREEIAAGTVTIGTEQSEVADGKVERAKVPCDVGHVVLGKEQAKQSGGMAFRKGPPKGNQPEVTIYGLAPVFETKASGKLVIERVDVQGERIEIEIAGPQMLRGTFFDLAKTTHALSPGGVYRASLGGAQIVFKVDALAKPGPAPVIGRLLRLAPAA